MPDEIQIRSAVPADASDIAEIHVRSWRAAYPGILPDEYLMNLSVEKHTTFWARELSEDTTITLVAVRGGAITGWVSGGKCRDPDASGCSEIHAIYVSPEHWGGGTGRKLMEAMQTRMHSGSATTLWVLEQNRCGISFYHCLGFAADGAAKTIKIAGTEQKEIRLRKEWTAKDISRKMAES